MPQLIPQQPPPADYYAGNLRIMLNHVVETYGDLLADAERRYVDGLLGLDRDGQRLYARLLGRKGPWIRKDKLAYREVGDVDRAIDSLEQAGLVHVNTPAPADALLGLLTQAERRERFPMISGTTRTQWIGHCVSRFSDAWIRRQLAESHPWISVSEYRHVRLCQLLFFGDDRQDMSTFVLQDLGLLRFEDYPLRAERRLFPDRATLDRYRELRCLNGLAHRLGELPSLADWLAESLWRSADTRQEQRQRDRILNRLGHYYERTGEFDRALGCYALSRMHPSRERRARMLTKLGDGCGAQALATRMREEPRCAEEEDFASRFGKRQRNQHEITEIPLRETLSTNIEAHAARLIGAGGAAVFHLENSFPLSLTGLAFWDVIFDDLPGAFTNPFQSGPLDLFWPDFASTRAARLQQRLVELDDPAELRAALRRTWHDKQGIANRLVSWRHLTGTVLETTLQNVPPEAILSLVSYVIRWPYRTRNGFPDLVVIYGPGNYEFVEVKGPTDQLQPGQRVWLKALAQMGHPARVLKFRSC